MLDTLPYARPTFVERQGLISKGNGWGTVAVVLAICSFSAIHALWVLTSMPGAWPIGVVAAGILLFVAFITISSKLITVVEAGELRLSLNFGPIRVWRRVFPLSTVVGCEVVEPGGPMSARPGWHLVKVPGVAVLKFFGGDTYVMVRRGKPAVVIALGSFKGVVVGSQRPEELAEAIRAAMSPIPGKPG